MEILATARDISKSYGSRVLFSHIGFVIGTGERIGLIGPNGAGKSTILDIIAGGTAVDSGEVSFKRGLKVGFLRQSPVLPTGQTVQAAVSAHTENEALVGEVLSRLHLGDVVHQNVETLSGGWQKRVALARELVLEPDLLLLDEPTNHLDIESILWLESFLTRSEISIVTVTHDRLFLQRVTNRILEVDRRNPQGMLSVDGDYATYLDRKESLLQEQEKLEGVLRNKMRRETEWLRRGPKARTTKQQARIQAAGELIDSVAELSARNQTRTARIDFGSTDRKTKRLIEAKGIAKSLGGRQLFQNASFFIGPGDRLGLLGNNGCGKSTLIRVLLGLESNDAGEILRAPDIKIAYFEQKRDALDPSVSLKQSICPHGDHVNYRGRMIHVNGYLDRFLFKKEQLDLRVGRLSGGEQARVLIAQLMLQAADILVLDEPTNDLDVETLDILEDCLKEFPGGIILVTHDRFFLDQVATEIHAFTPRGIVPFASVHQWENWMKENPAGRSETPKSAPAAAAPKKKKLGFNETRELAQMESKIHEAEARLLELQTESQSPAHAANASKLMELYTQLTEAQALVDRLYARWSELEALKS